MIDMVRKHTEPGSGDHYTICDMIDRTKEMLQQSKISERSKDASRSSPGQMRGRHSGKSEHPPSTRAEPSIDSEQLKGLDQPTESERAEAMDVLSEPNGEMFFIDSKPTSLRGIPTTAHSMKRPTKSSKPIEPTTSADPYVATADSSSSPLKRKASDALRSSTHNDKKFKQANTTLKRKASSGLTDPSRKKYSAGPSSNSVVAGGTIIDPTATHGETEDITHIVDARMAAREERRRLNKANRKGEKRKRESDASALDRAPDGGSADAAAVLEKQKEPEQKRIKPTEETRREKKRKRESEGSAAAGADVGDTAPIAIDNSIKEPEVKKVGKKTNRKTREEADIENAVREEPEKPKKKKMKITEKETAEKHTLPPNGAGPEDAPKKKKANISSPKDTADQKTKKHAVDHADADEANFVDEEAHGESKKKRRRKTS